MANFNISVGVKPKFTKTQIQEALDKRLGANPPKFIVTPILGDVEKLQLQLNNKKFTIKVGVEKTAGITSLDKTLKSTQTTTDRITSSCNVLKARIKEFYETNKEVLQGTTQGAGTRGLLSALGNENNFKFDNLARYRDKFSIIKSETKTLKQNYDAGTTSIKKATSAIEKLSDVQYTATSQVGVTNQYDALNKSTYSLINNTEKLKSKLQTFIDNRDFGRNYHNTLQKLNDKTSELTNNTKQYKDIQKEVSSQVRLDNSFDTLRQQISNYQKTQSVTLEKTGQSGTLKGLLSKVSGVDNRSIENLKAYRAEFSALKSDIKTITSVDSILNKSQTVLSNFDKKNVGYTNFSKTNTTTEDFNDNVEKVRSYASSLKVATAELEGFRDIQTKTFDTKAVGFQQSLQNVIGLTDKLNIAMKQVAVSQEEMTAEKNIVNMQNTWKKLESKLMNIGTTYKDLFKYDSSAQRQFEELQSKFANTDINNINKQDTQKMTGDISDLDSRMKQLAYNTDTVWGRMNKLFHNRFGSLVASMGIFQLINALGEIKNNVIAIDSALTQLEIVTGVSGNALQSYFEEAKKSAQELGISITDVLSSMETYARLGYSADEASILANVTGQMANVGAMTTDEATTGMTAILKAYDIKAEDATKIGDILTTVGKKYAISASELSEALENGGSSLEAANNSLEQSVALAAAGNAAVQDAGKVGRVLPTLKIAISVKSQRWSRPRKDYIDIVTHQLGRVCFFI